MLDWLLTSSCTYSIDKDLIKLSELGHFLKGSSATLGFTKIRDECEKIQHWGHNKDETGENDEPDSDKCVRLIQASIAKCETEYRAIRGLMDSYYAES